MMKTLRYYLVITSSLLPAVAYAAEPIATDFDWSARSRYVDFSGAESARAASLLLRFNANTQWNNVFATHLQLDNVSRAFKNDHSDGVDLNGKPIIPDVGGFDLNQAYLSADFDRVKFQLGRQRINLDNQRFIGGNGFWQNEQTFDAVSSNVKVFSNSQFTYAYIDNVNRIFGDGADKYIHSNDNYYGNVDTERPAGLRGDHRHHTHIAQLNYNEWDYSQLVAYGYVINNLTLPSASNSTLGANYTFTYKQDAIKYRVNIESAVQKQPELNNSPLLPFYVLDAGIGISHIELNARYEVLSNKEGINFVTPLGSLHDFQGLANQIQNYASQGLKDSSLNIAWRATPFKFEAQYHHFNAYTAHVYLAQELDLIVSYKPTRKHAVTLLTTFFTPESGQPQKSTTRKMYLDYSYNF
jgi:hypothetical protein